MPPHPPWPPELPHWPVLLLSRLKHTTHRHATLKKPQVDGATGGAEGHGAVAALVKLILGSGGGAKGGGRKGGKGAAPLGRPVVCLANDLYAPALRPLRDAARVVHFKPPARARLVERLAAVCRAEGLAADRAALQALADRARCDVRACLNTLQLLARQQRAAARARAARRRGGGGGGGGVGGGGAPMRITSWMVRALQSSRPARVWPLFRSRLRAVCTAANPPQHKATQPKRGPF